MLHRLLLLIICIPAFLLAAGCSLVENSDAVSSTETVVNQPVNEAGTIIIQVETEPANQPASFTFTGVPSGTLTVESSLVLSGLEPGTYTTTEVDPAPDFDVTTAHCQDSIEGLASSSDPQTRTAVVNLDAGETVTCTFTNTQRATAVVTAQTEPEAAGGQFLFTGVPSGTIPVDGTLVVAELPPGTYTTTEADPAPEFDLTAVSCDDEASATASAGDPTTRSANFQLDPGEMVTCVFLNTRRGTAIINVETDGGPDDATFQYTGVPSGTIAAGGSLTVTDLSTGTYTSTEVDPAPDYELVDVACNDAGGGLASSGDPTTRSAIFNVDAGEAVTCNFIHEYIPEEIAGGSAAEEGDASGGGEQTAAQPGLDDLQNPFTTPDPDFEKFPLPEELPPAAGTDLTPLPGPWTAYNLAGQMDCGVMTMDIPAQPAENGIIELQDGRSTIVGRGLSADQGEPMILSADPDIAGRYFGTFEGTEQGVPIVIDYYWQVVTEEYIVGYLTSTFSQEGVSCNIYRPFELRFSG